ncbi:hypothetical protein JTE90_028915 [Oedothorax gibbosus]|uniref:Mutator-like transposase domain-containing protein n=1 Tax=Oedothorax gibbosus TaxID=931172 RepID=A0AAV6TXZ5_9ARAC|nr:hypothetical protein JTE90_028915 [Oedothorax gibbosus]
MPRVKKQGKHLYNIRKMPKRVDVPEIAEPSKNKNVVMNERLLNLSNVSEEDKIIQVSSKSKFVLIDIDMVNTLLLSAAFPECQQSQLKLNCKNNYGFAHKMELFCLNCNACINSSCSSKRLENTKGFEVNKFVTEAFLYFGKGYAAVEQFGMLLGMDVMSDKTFSEYTRIVFKDLEETTRKVLEDTRNRVKKPIE